MTPPDPDPAPSTPETSPKNTQKTTLQPPPISPLFDLSTKKAIVTGATGSIGLACTQALISHGAEIVLVARNQEKLDQAITHLPPGARLHPTILDFTNLHALETLFQTHSDATILVNSVGINRPKSVLDIDPRDYDAVMNTNVKLAFFQTQYFLRARKTQAPTPASIIHISSQMGFVGGDQRSIYCASKHALEGMCKAIALETGPWNIRINTICPTFIETELSRSTLADPKKRQHILSSIAMGRMGELSDLHGAVIYLASDASSLVTGTAIRVDGGWTAR